MPFGRHKDKELTRIPKTYLRWLHKQEWLQGSLAAAVAEVLGEKAPKGPGQSFEPEAVATERRRAAALVALKVSSRPSKLSRSPFS
jgi:hypothetical protein